MREVVQDYIQTLEASLQEEMSRHAPLYGAGLEALSLSELDTLSRIHEEGLRAVRNLQQQRQGGGAGGGGGGEVMMVSMQDPMGSHAALPPLGMYAAPSGVAVGMPSIMANGVHANGHLNGTISPWFPSS